MVYKFSLSPELEKQAMEELNEDPTRREEDIEHIRKWLIKQPHMTARTDDWMILRYLRGCKFSLERTKQKLDTYYTIRTMLPEWFTNRDANNPSIREIIKLGLMIPLKECDAKGRQVTIGRHGIIDPAKYDFNDFCKAMYLMLDLFLEENVAHSITGLVSIADMEGMSMAHFLQMPIVKMKQSSMLWQDGYPLRMKGLHYINAGSMFETMMSIFRPFLKDKLLKRIKVHSGNNETLFEDVPRRILPNEYGGEAGTIDEIMEFWLKKLDARSKHFMDDDKYVVDEAKRPGKPKTMVDLFGIDGSFRKLNVD